MEYVYIYSHAFSRDAARKTLRSLSSTLEKHLVKLMVGEERTREYWTDEIDNYINNEFDFIIKKDAGINYMGIYSILYLNGKNSLKDRIEKIISKLKKAGYYVNPEINEAVLDNMMTKFEEFYMELSMLLEKRYQTRKSGQKINVEELLGKTLFKNNSKN